MKKKQASMPVVKILDLDQLQKIVDAPMTVRFELDGTPVEIEVTRMTPAIAERQRAILREPQPPYHKERKDYDPLDPKYLAARDKAEIKARAVVVYYCCPIINKKKSCANDEEIFQFVSGMLTTHIQELIALQAQTGGMKVLDGANFTPPDGLGE